MASKTSLDAGHGHDHSRPGSRPGSQHAGDAGHDHGHGAKAHDDHEKGHGHDRGGGHHAHDHGGSASGTLLGIAFALTATFMLVEFTGGLFARSLALVADAGHMLTDAAALALAWAATRLASKPADARRSFGYQRLRVLATFVNGCALLAIVAWIAAEAVQRLMQPATVNGTAILLIGGLGLVVNLVVFALLRRGDGHDMNIAAASLHVMGDLLGSVAAIVAGVVILWTGWSPIDPILSVLVCLLIVRGAIALIRRSAHILMEGAPDWLDPRELRSTLELRVPAILDVHHVHCWQVGPNETLLTMHIAVDKDSDRSSVLKQAQVVLVERFGITHATIQIEEEEDCVDSNDWRCAG
jgi:cobalt-zinc-cadmium efflux system protein